MLLENSKRKLNSVTLVSFFIVGVFIAFYTISRLVYFNSCTMDYIRCLLHSRCIGMISLIAAVSYMINSRNDYDLMHILLISSWKRLLLKKIISSSIYSMVITIYAFSVTILLSMIAGEPFNNWDKSGSLYNETFHTLNYTSVFTMLLISYVIVFMLIFLTVLLVVVGMQVFDSAVLPLTIIIAVVTNDSMFKYVPIFYNRFNIVYDQWNNPILYGLKALLWLFLFLIIILAIGTFFQKRKEYIGHKEIN